ncbi:Uncharacterised protein [Pantoea agglomerans]|uniref:Uncharacterized protein n=1 Tax=Enterobacter agglomerans TaxID=549 RepID=A0A379AJD4_ENTAG|nr:Uncharacterised protein [Pantoea agglomerans]
MSARQPFLLPGAQLRKQKVLAGKGRSGVWVSSNTVMPRPIRFEKIGNYGDNIRADLTLAAPDPALLPDLQRALQAALHSPQLNSYTREAIFRAAASGDRAALALCCRGVSGDRWRF